MKIMTMLAKYYTPFIAAVSNLTFYDKLMSILDKFGFPILVVVACFWYINKIQEEYRADYNELHESHAEEVKALTTALTQNTETIRALKDMLDDINFIAKEN